MNKYILILTMLLIIGDFTVLAIYVLAAYILSKLLEDEKRR